VWADDNETLLYIERDPTTLLGVRVKRHRLGTDAAADSIAYEEQDDSFYMSLSRSGDEYYIMLHLGSTVADEICFLPAARPADEFSVLHPRQRDHEYDADHSGDHWIIRTNWQAKNFRLMTVSDGHTQDREQWLELVAHDEQVYIGEFDIFDNFLVIAERRDGLRTLKVLDRHGHSLFPVAADDPAYVMDFDTNMEPNTNWLRYSYSSLTTPETIYAVNMQTHERRMLKQQPVLGGFDSDHYRSERLWVTARDGAHIPVSLLYRKDYVQDKSAPLYLYAYGAYGYSTDPAFEDEILSLVDRGFVYAIAHVRSGQELGRNWYDTGKLQHKINTFTDFIDVTTSLIDSNHVDPTRIAISGGSAGGLLIGAVANMRPDLYRAAVADVPFVDIITTMLDASIPLTTNEYDEWGNPENREDYDYLLHYSPYDNVRAQDYPAMLVTTGLWDSQVQYYEPAKWVAKLRATKTDNNPLILHINMDAGHGGQSGRFRRNKELAMEYAFILDQLEVSD
ncbi:MAG: prolyl oligopeptidase family serine peptidase, partial [Gammaproteobacteria bacterium]|nr:prolyl oligopeptidase family serine peptidase [Gammaproteobacteria bacterium]